MSVEEERHFGAHVTPLGTLPLWELLFGNLEGYLVTFTGRQSERPDARQGELDDRQQRYWRYPADRERAAAYLLRQSEVGRDAYFGVHLFEEPGNRRGDNALDRVGAAWVDGDGAQVPGDWPQPNVVIKSSPGREQFYWLLEEPVFPEEAATISKRLAYGMGADKGKWGLGTVLRAPGTRNYKRAEPHEVSGVLTHDRRYSAAELSERLPEPPEKPSAAKTTRASARTDRGAGGPPVALSGKALEIYEGRAPIIGDGGVDRSATLMQIASVLYSAGLERPALVPALEERDRTLGYEKYTRRPQEYDRKVDKLEAGGRSTPAANGTGNSGAGGSGTPPGASSPNNTDLGNARRMVARHGGDLRWCGPWGKWLSWDGRRYAADQTGEVHRRAKETAANIYAEAARIPDEGLRKTLVKHALNSESRARIEAMVELAKSEPGIPVVPDELDSDPWLFNLANGTLDLRTGELREHDRRDLITKMSPVTFDPEARSPVFEAVLEKATGGDRELGAFLRRWAGYCLTGDTGEEKIVFAHGPAATAKSTVLEALKAAWGDYAATADFEAFLARRESGGPRNDIARLAGKRLVVSIEVDEGKKLAEGLIKMLTGGDTVTARFLYQEAFEFAPQFKITLAANHAPQVRDDDEAMWRRILRVPFEAVIPKAERKSVVKKKLKDPEASGPAILAWAVEGCREWRADGLGVPPAVEAATEEYREEMDPLRDFIADYCVLGPQFWAAAGQLREAYEKWAREAGEEKILKGRKWGERLREYGCTPATGTGGLRIWTGIALRSGPDDSLEAPDDGPEAGRVADSATEENACKTQENAGESCGFQYGIGKVPSETVPREELPTYPQLSATPQLEGADEGVSEAVQEPSSAPTRGLPEALAEFLSDPPEWWRRQAAVVLERGSPGRLVAPLASSTAAKVLGTPLRHAEAREAVEQKLREMGAEEVGG